MLNWFKSSDSETDAEVGGCGVSWSTVLRMTMK